MTGSSGDPSCHRVHKLLERHHPREAFRIHATNILSRDQHLRERLSPSTVEKDPRKITISRRPLQQFRNWETEQVRVPTNEKEAHYLIEKWRKGGPVKTGDIVGLILYSNMTNRRKRERGSDVVSHNFPLVSQK